MQRWNVRGTNAKSIPVMIAAAYPNILTNRLMLLRELSLLRVGVRGVTRELVKGVAERSRMQAPMSVPSPDDFCCIA